MSSDAGVAVAQGCGEFPFEVGLTSALPGLFWAPAVCGRWCVSLRAGGLTHKGAAFFTSGPFHVVKCVCVRD